MRFAYRLGWGFGALTLLLLLAGLIGLSAATGARETAHLAQQDLAVTRELRQFQLDAERVAIAENSIAFDYNSASDTGDDLSRFASSVDGFDQNADLVGRLSLTGSQRAILDTAVRAFNTYIVQSRQANAYFVDGTPRSKAAANDLVNGLAYRGVTTGLDDLSVDIGSNIDRSVAAQRLFAQRAILLVAGLGVAGLVFSALLSTTITRSIVRPLRHTVRVLDAVAEGDFTQSLDATSSDEFGQMGRSLNRTVGLLRTMVVELTDLAGTDPLTQLPNRAVFYNGLQDAIDGDNAEQHWVLFIDLNDFKKINDSHGHGVGDLVLQEVADLLRRSTRSEDLRARLGGDEFAVLLRNINRSRAEAIADRIAQANLWPARLARTNARVTVSVGLAAVNSQTTVDDAIQRADTAMYVAKATAKGSASATHPRPSSLDDSPVTAAGSVRPR